ncbi:MAG: TetR/AcrR family transcriptional regulator [Nitrospiraceae bacterium]
MLQTPPSRVERRKEKTRKILLGVALGLFYEQGIYWTKIEDITERADIGKGTFYQYFETKEELLKTLLQLGLDVLLARTSEAIDGVKPDSKILSRIIQAQLEFHIEHPEYLLFFHQIRGLLQFTTEPVNDLRKVYNVYLDQLAEVIEPALNGRGGAGASARELAMAVSAFSLGLLTHHLLFDKAGTFKHRRDDIQAVLERSIYALV